MLLLGDGLRLELSVFPLRAERCRHCQGRQRLRLARGGAVRELRVSRMGFPLEPGAGKGAEGQASKYCSWSVPCFLKLVFFFPWNFLGTSSTASVVCGQK